MLTFLKAFHSFVCATVTLWFQWFGSVWFTLERIGEDTFWRHFIEACYVGRVFRRDYCVSPAHSAVQNYYYFVTLNFISHCASVEPVRFYDTLRTEEGENQDENVSTNVVELWAISRRHYQGITNYDDRSKSRTSVTSRACDELWWYQQSNILLSQCGENGW